MVGLDVKDLCGALNRFCFGVLASKCNKSKSNVEDVIKKSCRQRFDITAIPAFSILSLLESEHQIMVNVVLQVRKFPQIDKRFAS